MLEYKIWGDGDDIIVFENGLGGPFHDWNFVAEAIKEHARLIGYHRTGYGNSGIAKENRDTRQISKELNSLLDELGIKQKIILVGHSSGGLCVQHFARLYPERVKGVILLDSTSMNFKRLYSQNLPVMDRELAIEKLTNGWLETSKKSREEIEAMSSGELLKERKLFPSSVQEKIIEFEAVPKVYYTMAMEMLNWEKSSEDIKSSGDFPNVPLTVIARDIEVSVASFVKYDIPEDEARIYENVWRELIIEQALLSNDSKLVVAHGSDHCIQLEKPMIVIECIKEMLKIE